MLYEHHVDPLANEMAGTKPRPRDAYFAHWQNILLHREGHPRTILLDGSIVGSIGAFVRDGIDFVGYSIAREWWGKGIATRALVLLLAEVPTRPLRARVAKPNVASARVLEKCGFRLEAETTEPETDRFVPGPVLSFILE